MAMFDLSRGLVSLLYSREARKRLQLKYNPTSLVRKGLNLVKRFRWMTLSIQHRSKDPIHTDCVMKLWRGEQVCYRDLMRYKIFKAGDVQEDPEWLVAPLLVATNQERLSMVHTRAIAYAKAHGTCVLRWQLEFAKWKGCPRGPCERKMAMEDPAFFEYFVAGAPGFITTNICPM